MSSTARSTDILTRPIDTFDNKLNFYNYYPFKKKTASRRYKFLKCFLALWVGLIIGSLSLSFIDPHTIINNKILGFINLVIFPVLAAKGFQEFIRYYGKEYINISSNVFFWGAFWFSLGFLVVRYLVSAIM